MSEIFLPENKIMNKSKETGGAMHRAELRPDKEMMISETIKHIECALEKMDEDVCFVTTEVFLSILEKSKSMKIIDIIEWASELKLYPFLLGEYKKTSNKSKEEILLEYLELISNRLIKEIKNMDQTYSGYGEILIEKLEEFLNEKEFIKMMGAPIFY